ncbi:RluA family pseudouridine synthase [Desulfovibrio ferrophilus]|uniref:Pseudouridine synthase n=1 Tax=Desulfovibrio ferrophilus TaxID=241368 RepID=A0A2Z6B208_9BACT|nr:RluA family pseudouridine synthase [Desulfovibrio ferrophilus]BBD09436.1 pseudouridine synthase [Desulfovibrio ferrophilus]
MPKVQHIIVSADEGGQKLLNFLRRRLGPDVPQSLLMRIIRKGEVRVDKGRAKPFDRLSAGQDVRIPPIRVQERMQTPAGVPLEIIFREKGLLAVAKPAGLPVQPGTGHSDAVSERLRAQFAEADFTPTPAHRLDRDTSGILLCGASFEALRNLQQGFAEHSIGKFYLAWVQGSVEPGTVLEMQDEMDKTGAHGHERMTIGSGKTALALARCLTSDDGRSLLEIDLRTGRTHQIRLQLASRGLPIIGDSKYGFKTRTQKMYLHAWKIVLGSGEIITNLPAWNSPYQLVNDWFK